MKTANEIDAVLERIENPPMYPDYKGLCNIKETLMWVLGEEDWNEFPFVEEEEE